MRFPKAGENFNLGFLSGSICSWNDADKSSLRAFVVKFYNAADFGKKRVILPQADIQTGFEAGTPLTHQDGTARHWLAGKSFYTQPLGIGIASVSGTTYTFFMCHISSLTFPN
jgi:hypothetical protein